MKTYVDELMKMGFGPIYSSVHHQNNLSNSLDDVACNIRRVNFILELNEELADEVDLREFVVQNLDNFTSPPSRFEDCLEDLKSKCISSGISEEELTLSHFIENEFNTSNLSKLSYLHEDNIERFKSFLLNSAIHDVKNNPFVLIRRSELENNGMMIGSAINLVSVTGDPIKVEDSIIHESLHSTLPDLDQRDLIDDFLTFAQKSFKHNYERSTGRSIEVIRDTSDDVLHRGIVGKIGTVFEDIEANKRFLVSFMMPENMSNRKTTEAKSILNESEAAYDLSWQHDALLSIDSSLKVDDVFVYQFGMSGINDYSQYINSASVESKQFLDYLNLRVDACLESQSNVIRDALYQIKPDPNKVDELEAVSKKVLQRIKSGHIPGPEASLSQEQIDELMSEAELLMKQYAINRKIIEHCSKSNANLSTAIDDYHGDIDAEFKSQFAHMSSKRVFKTPEEIVEIFSTNGVELELESITKTITKKTMVLDAVKLKKHLSEIGIDPKQFNNITESLRIATTKDFKQSLGPIIDQAAETFVKQIQSTNEHLLSPGSKTEPVNPSEAEPSYRPSV